MRVASSTVKAVNSFRPKQFRFHQLALPDRAVGFSIGDGYRVRPFGLLAGHSISFKRSEARTVQRVNRSIEAVGDDRPRRDCALRRVSLVMESCQGSVLPSGSARDAKDFFKRSLPGTNLEEPVFVERMKASSTSELFHRALILTSPANRVADVIVDYKEFGYRRPTAVTGIATGLAADRLPAVRKIYRRIAGLSHLELAVQSVAVAMRPRTGGTKLSDQPLRHDSGDRRSKQVALQPDIDQARNGSYGGVCVQGRKYQMASQGSLYRYACSFKVANFADHDDIRVLTQDRTQRGGKIETNLRLNLNLIDPGELIFDRIFYGEQFQLGSIKIVQCRI